MSVRLLLLSSVLALSGCGYPEFGFVADGDVIDSALADSDLETPDDSAASETEADSSVVDSSIDSTAIDSVSVDSTAIDTAVDSTAIDSAETSIPDAVAETGPVGCTGSTATFCTDFDTASTPEGPFGGFKDVIAPGTIALEATGAHSSPNLFVASTAPSGTATVIHANVYKTFTSTAPDRPMRVDVWIKLESITYPSTAGIAFLFKVERPSGTGEGVSFSIDDKGLFVDRIAADYERFPITTFTPKANVWMHVRMDVVLSTTAGSVKVWIDDMTTAVVDKSAISTTTVNETGRLFTVGLYAEKQTAPFKARFDDISFNFK